MAVYVCGTCDASKEAGKRPAGWKATRTGRLYCEACLTGGFVPRAVSLPVQAVIPEEGESSADAWRAFRQAVRVSGCQAAAVYNLAVWRLLAADTGPVTRSGGKTRLPPAPAGSELYGLARSECPELDSQSVGSVLQKARADYRGDRWSFRVTATDRPPFARAPAPVPIPEKDCGLTLVGPDRVPHAGVRLAGRRFKVRLASGGEWDRQARSVREIADGNLVGGEVKLVVRRVGGGGRNGGESRRQPGANRRPTRYLLAFSAWLPRRSAGAEAGKVLACRTGGGRLWTVAVGDRDLWFLNEQEVFRWLGEVRHALRGQPDWLRGLIIGHDDWLQRVREDRKFERRVGAERANLNDAQRRKADRYHDRLDDFCHKAARMLAGLAARQRCEAVEYDDRDQSYFPSFQWFKLRTLVGQKLAGSGITLRHVGGSDADGDQDVLGDL